MTVMNPAHLQASPKCLVSFLTWIGLAEGPLSWPNREAQGSSRGAGENSGQARAMPSGLAFSMETLFAHFLQQEGSSGEERLGQCRRVLGRICAWRAISIFGLGLQEAQRLRYCNAFRDFRVRTGQLCTKIELVTSGRSTGTLRKRPTLFGMP